MKTWNLYLSPSVGEYPNSQRKIIPKTGRSVDNMANYPWTSWCVICVHIRKIVEHLIHHLSKIGQGLTASALVFSSRNSRG